MDNNIIVAVIMFFQKNIQEIVSDFYKLGKKILVQKHIEIKKYIKIRKVFKRIRFLRSFMPIEYSFLYAFYYFSNYEVNQKFIPMKIAKELENQGFISIKKVIDKKSKIYSVNDVTMHAIILEFNKNGNQYLNKDIYDLLWR